MSRYIKILTSLFVFVIFLTSCGYVPIKNEVLLTNNLHVAPSNRVTFKVLSWNTHKQDNAKWYSDFNSLLNLENPNIILLQEASLNDRLVNKINNKNWGFSPNLYVNKNYSGVLIASDIESKNHMAKISNGTEPSFPFVMPPLSKAMLFSIYELAPNKPLLVVNAHALNFTVAKFWNMGKEYDEQIKLISYVVKNHNGPVIVAGDFNTWSSSRSDILKEFLLAAGLKEINFGDDQAAIAKCPLALNLIIWGCYSEPLDYIFYNNKLTLKSSSVLMKDSSDHNPLIVEFYIN